MSDSPVSLLVLGLGNVLCADDGAGVAAIELFRARYVVPDGVQILDGGTLGLSLLPYLQDAEQAIFVDAIGSDAPPGSIVRLEGDDVHEAAAHRLSAHQVGVADLLDAARLLDAVPDAVMLLGVVPASIELGVERTPEVERAIPELVERIAEEVRRRGWNVSRCEAPAGEPLPVARVGVVGDGVGV